MNLKTVKKLSEVKLEGITLEWIKEDDDPRELRITDKNGRHMVIRSGGNYSDRLRVLHEVPEEPETEA